ncbi:MAG: hypothetical protein ABI459_02500 [Deltaproteobacteria bacterium]
MNSRITFPMSLDITPANSIDLARLPGLLDGWSHRHHLVKFERTARQNTYRVFASIETVLYRLADWLVGELLEIPEFYAPEIAYRDILIVPVVSAHHFQGQSDEQVVSAHVKIALIHCDRNRPARVSNLLTVGVVEPDVAAHVSHAITAILDRRADSGSPIFGARIRLLEAEGDNPEAIEAATKEALNKALARACVPHEPIMSLRITAPEGAAREIANDLSARRGKVSHRSCAEGSVTLEALVPCATLFGYEANLQAITKADGAFSYSLSHYAPVPGARDPVLPDSFRPALSVR